MQFEMRYAKGIADGSITLTFRRWKRPQAIAGNTYRTAGGRLVVDGVAVVNADEISDADARKAGYASGDALRADLRGDAGSVVYRVAFHPAPGADPRDELAAADSLSEAEIEEVRGKLARLDRASPRGPWTAATLQLIAREPARRAGDLAPQLRQEVPDFKLNVRKLKNLGLTISLGVGYRLSPRGEAFLAGRG